MSTFDIKKFLINEGMTRVSRDRKRLLKEEHGRESWADNASYDEMVDWIVEYLGDIALSLGYDWDPSRNLRFDSDNGWWFEAEEGPTEDSPFEKIWLPEDETDPESDATLLKYYKNDVEALRTLIKNVDWDTLTVTDEIAKDLNEAAPAGWSEDEWEEYRSRKEAEKIFRQGGAGDRRGATNRSAMGNQQGRRRGLKGSTQAPTWLVSENVTDQDYEAYREWQKDNGWDDETIDAAIKIWKQHPDMFAIELENPVVDDLEAFVAEPELYLSGDPEDLTTAVKQNIYRR